MFVDDVAQPISATEMETQTTITFFIKPSEKKTASKTKYYTQHNSIVILSKNRRAISLAPAGIA